MGVWGVWVVGGCVGGGGGGGGGVWWQGGAGGGGDDVLYCMYAKQDRKYCSTV